MALTGGTRQAIEVFKQAKYDHMDVETKQFDTDFYNFQSQIKELERRLASVITQVLHSDRMCSLSVVTECVL